MPALVNWIEEAAKKTALLLSADVRAAGEALKKIDTPEAKQAAKEFDKKVSGSTIHRARKNDFSPAAGN
jgi:hypothetical protein